MADRRLLASSGRLRILALCERDPLTQTLLPQASAQLKSSPPGNVGMSFVIGAGIGGLVAATQLAAKGYRVLVLENTSSLVAAPATLSARIPTARGLRFDVGLP